MLKLLRRYWPLIPIAMVFAVAAHQEWLNKTTPQPPLGAAAPQIPALAVSQPPSPSAVEKSSSIQSPPASSQTTSGGQALGTEQHPFVIKNTPETQSETANDAAYQQQRTSDKYVLEIGIGAIVVGFLQTVALFVTFGVVAYVGVGQLRAYIYPNVKGLMIFSLTEPSVVSVEWHNAGQTPARHFETHGIVLFGQLPLPDTAGFGDSSNEPPTGRHTKATLYPGADHMSDYSSFQKLDAEAINALSDGKLALYVLGEATYRDIFGLKRKTGFCQYILSEDMKKVLAAEKATGVMDMELRWAWSHVLNDFR